MASDPQFTATPVIGKTAISTANTNRDGTGTLGAVITGGVSGTRISRITIQATGAVTGGMVRLFIDNGAGAIHLWKEVPVTATTPSGTVQAFVSTIDLTGEYALILPSGYILKAGTHNAEAFNIIAEGGDF